MTDRRLTLPEVVNAYKELGYTPAPGVTQDGKTCGFLAIQDKELGKTKEGYRKYIKQFGQHYVNGFMNGFDKTFGEQTVCYSYDTPRYKEGLEDGHRIGEQIQILENLKGVANKHFRLEKMMVNMGELMKMKFELSQPIIAGSLKYPDSAETILEEPSESHEITEVAPPNYYD